MDNFTQAPSPDCVGSSLPEGASSGEHSSPLRVVASFCLGLNSSILRTVGDAGPYIGFTDRTGIGPYIGFAFYLNVACHS